MPDYNQIQVGAVIEPLPDIGDGNSMLRDADPAIFFLLDFLQYVIRHYPGPRFMQEVAKLQNVDGIPLNITDPCLNAYPVDPKPEYLENQLAFPAVYVFRTQGQTEQWTVASDHDGCGITVVYILPPLDAAQAERLYPMLHAVHKAIRRKVTDASDPGYTPPGGNPGDQFTARAYANIEEIGFGQPIDRRAMSVSTGFEYGSLAGAGTLVFPALFMRGYIIERDEFNPTIGGLSLFDGLDLTANAKASDGTVVPATSTTVVQASSHQPPTVTSLSVATGPSNSPTSVTATGTGFMTGPPTVYFGPASSPTYATGVSYSSPTSISFTTPAMQGAGAVDITIRNRDGQQVVLPGAFTFT